MQLTVNQRYVESNVLTNGGNGDWASILNFRELWFA